MRHCRFVSAAAAAAAVVAAAALGTTAAAATSPVPARRPVPGTYFVETHPHDGDPVEAIRGQLAVLGVVDEAVTFRTRVNTSLFTGASFELSTQDAGGSHETLLSGLSVRSVWPVSYVPRPAPVALSSETAALRDALAGYPPEAIHNATGVDEARSRLGLTGAGVSVGVIDMGIYYTHPALGGCFGSGCKVAFGYDLVGDNYNGSTASLAPDNDPMDDCSSEAHGTHVAGIVAGDARNMSLFADELFQPPAPWSGVAIGATLGAYRVFSCSGETTFDIVAAAIYRAAEDGADIITMSLGGGPGFMDDFVDIAVDRVSQAGHIVTSAAGNDGSASAFSHSNPGGAELGFGVASFDNIQTVAYTLYVNGEPFPYFATSNFDMSIPMTMSASNVVIGNITAIEDNATNDNCFVNTYATATGPDQAVIVYYEQPTSCNTAQKCRLASNFGGFTYCFIMFGKDIDPTTTAAGYPYTPGLSFSYDAGQAIIAALASNAGLNLTLTYETSTLAIPTAGTVSYFSAYGLTPELFLKPDFGAYGGKVLSSVSPAAAEAQYLPNAYAVYSGTSMATPYVAGAIALYLEAKGLQNFTTVKTAFQNAAQPMKMYESTLIESPAHQGAGLINVYDAVTATTIITPSAIALNDTDNMQRKHSLTITNLYSEAVDYTISSYGAAAISYLSDGDDVIVQYTQTGFSADYATVVVNDKDSKTVRIQAGESHTVTVSFTPPAGLDISKQPIYAGYITVADNRGSPVQTVPYAGVLGSWFDANIIVRQSPSLAARGYQLGGIQSYFVDEPLKNNSVVNLDQYPVSVGLVFAQTTRYVEVFASYVGSNATVAAQLAASGLPASGRLGLAAVTCSDVSNAPDLCIAQLANMQRCTALAAQTVGVGQLVYWAGSVVVEEGGAGGNATAVRVPPGAYTVTMRALRNFGTVGAADDAQYDVFESPVINVVYNS
ncbi:hypothetical protein HK405_013213 [Cladochytrium tenue]|nr:hypothetical protein HK405_013213 [Cladochytrium tenue]